MLRRDSNEESQPLVGLPDLPPPYTPSPATPTYSGSNITLSPDAPVINCRVCHTLLHIEGKLHLHVIKCHACGEATPIRPAPPMKKYVRCPCNCLLICKVTSQRIVCPRVNCKRVISLLPMPLNINHDENEQNSYNIRIICAYCNFSFLPLKSLEKVQQCPHCNVRSFSSSFYKKRLLRLFGYCTFLLLCLLIVAVILNFTIISFQNSLSIIVCISLLSLIFLGMLVSYARISFIKSSRIERLSSLQYT